MPRSTRWNSSSAYARFTKFIEYAVQGLRDGLKKTLETIQQSQHEITWLKLIYDRFAEKKYVKRSVFKRQRKLALSFPTDKALTLAEVPLISAEVARDYANLSERTIRRDIETLIKLGIMASGGDKFFANTEILRGQVAQRADSQTANG